VSRNIYVSHVYFQTKLYFNVVRIREVVLTQILRETKYVLPSVPARQEKIPVKSAHHKHVTDLDYSIDYRNILYNWC
jgi:hypothetical protein